MLSKRMTGAVLVSGTSVTLISISWVKARPPESVTCTLLRNWPSFEVETAADLSWLPSMVKWALSMLGRIGQGEGMRVAFIRVDGGEGAHGGVGRGVLWDGVTV